MIFIGVTGGIGSGKSIVCSLFEKKEISIFYADAVAKEIVDSNSIVLQEIVKVFGNQILLPSKLLDRKALAEIVFNDEDQLDKLNQIVHPRVFEAFAQWKDKLSGENNYSLVESALLFESGMFELVDYALAVIADEDTRTQRVAIRDSVKTEQITARMKNQISYEELLELSDFQIQNNGTILDLTSKINFFHTLFSTLKPPKEIE